MGLQKTKRILVWCSQLPHNIGNYEGERRRNKIGDTTIPNRVRCPVCNKAFRPKIDSDDNVWHVSVPAHKRYIKPKK